MPDPYDPPDPGPIDDLQRETERIARALSERAEARAQRNLAEQSSAQRAAGERAEQDAERRRDDSALSAGNARTGPDHAVDRIERADQSAADAIDPDVRRQAATDADRFGDEARTQRDRGAQSGDRAARSEDRTQSHERLADRLEAHGIDRGLAQTRVRADRSFRAPATAISGRTAAGGRSAEPARARTSRGRQAVATERPRSR